MIITNLENTKKTRVEMEGAKDVFKQIPIGTAEGAPNFSFRVFTVKPGGYTPYHTHPFEHVNYIIEGIGALIDEKGTDHRVEKGDFAIVLPNEKHRYQNKSKDSPLVMICAVPRQYE